MAKKEYKYEIRVSRGWAGVEEIQIATGTDNEAELKDLVNQAAEAMQDRADWHQEQRKIADEITRKGIEEAQAVQAAAELANNNEGN